jgi:hypothetical protein
MVSNDSTHQTAQDTNATEWIWPHPLVVGSHSTIAENAEATYRQREWEYSPQWQGH